MDTTEDLIESSPATTSSGSAGSNRRQEIRAALLAVPFILTLSSTASAAYGEKYSKGKGKGK